MIIPSLLGPTFRRLQQWLGGAMGMEGRLGLRFIDRLRTRTALTVGVLSIGLMVSVGYGNTMLNSVKNIREWAARVGAVDFFVRASLPDPGTMTMSVGLPPGITDEVQSISEVASADRLSFLPAVTSLGPVVILAQDFERQRPMRLDLVSGEHDEVRERLLDGEIVIGSVLAQRNKLEVGDRIGVQSTQGMKELRITGTVTEYTTGGMNVGMNWETARTLFEGLSVHVFMIQAVEGGERVLHEKLAALCRERGLMLQSNAEFAAMVDRYMDGVTGSLFVIMALVFLVAMMGTINTLTMNILEQTREIGVLRAVAMKRGQLRRMIVLQAAAIGLAALVPGLVGGFALAIEMDITTYPLTGTVVEFQVDVVFICICVTVALGVAMLAAVVPARRAARLEIIEALHYE